MPMSAFRSSVFRGHAAVACVALPLFAASAARAQEPDCYLPGATTIVIGGSLTVDWRMKAGYSCAFRLRIGYRHNLESISVVKRARLGRAGASTDRMVDEAGRVTLTIAYSSPHNTAAGSDEFTVRAVTRDRESGGRAETLLTYRVAMWK